MRCRLTEGWVWAAPLSLALSACGASPVLAGRDVEDANDLGRTLAPVTTTERQMLAQLGTLPSGTPRTIGGAAVRAEPPYDSASGRTCRALQITDQDKATHRLACRRGRAWVLVPDVFGSSSVGN